MRHSGQEKTWQKNAPSQIVLDSIFAALAALWITVTLQERPYILIKVLELTCALLSFFLLAISAEGTTTAYDEKDVTKFVYYLLWYNVGVILLGNAIGLVILVHFYQRISAQWTVVPQWLLWIILGAGYLAVFVLLLWRWIDDATWLFWRASNAEFDKYCDELGDLRTPSFDRRFLMRRIFERRLRHANRFPHENVYTRLKPSNIDGVGVFAVKDIAKGTYVFAEDDEPIVWIDKQSVSALPKELKRLYEDFSIITDGKYGCPESFDKLTTSWYLNHSEDPNVAADENYTFYALRDIKAGEELTADYRTYSELPSNMDKNEEADDTAVPPRP
jgi:hypothetical protein